MSHQAHRILEFLPFAFSGLRSLKTLIYEALKN
jgi:hypothetical protein